MLDVYGGEEIEFQFFKDEVLEKKWTAYQV